MKSVRGLTVVSWVAVSLPLAVACGSAGSDGLFSASGGTTNSDKAGASGVRAGASSAGADTAGVSSGGASEAAAGETGVAGKGSAGVGEPSAGSPGAGGKGQSGAPGGGNAGAATGGSGTGAGGATAGAGGSNAGAGGSGGIVGSANGGSGHGVSCPANGAPTPGAPCQVTTASSCFYSGIACSCQQVGPSTFIRKWACYGTPAKCPNDKPADGSGLCKNGAECPYPGGDFCVCAANGDRNGGGAEPRFACQTEARTCPAKPFQGAACTTVRTCAYADDQCFCNGDSWACESNN